MPRPLSLLLRNGGYGLAVTLLLAPFVTTAADAQAAPEVKVVGGRTQPVFSYKDAIREHVMVETPVDSDGDGKRDRAGVDIIRPKESDQGLKVPVIMDNSPYFDNAGRGNESEKKAWDAQGRPTKFPLFYDNYFVPRGYAMVLTDMIGTTKSDGCPDTGGAADVAAGKAVVDWLNGRANAYGLDGKPVRATWATGKVGMIGKSYDGTLPNAVAATGVQGLETIVPISAISTWYRYYRMNGVVYFADPEDGPASLADFVDTDPPVKCAQMRQRILAGADDATGNYNAWWNDRNYIAAPTPDVSKVRASVFAVHTTGDLNVKPDNFSKWWQALAERGVPRKLWLGKYAHVDPFDFRREVWIDTLHRWFDHWLYKIDNGIMREARADVQTGPDQWVTAADWPAPTASVPLRPRPGGGAGLAPAPAGSSGSFTDTRLSEAEMVADPTASKPGRLAFVTPPLRGAVRLSGTPIADIRAKLSKPDARLTALVVDYGEDTRVDYLGEGGGIRTLTEESCHGESTPADDACYKRTETVTKTGPLDVIGRGWLDAKNRRSLSRPEQLRPGTYYRFTWEALPHDYIVKPGHRLGLVLAGADGDNTHDPATGATVIVDLAGSRVILPVTPVTPMSFAPAPRSWQWPITVDLPRQPRNFS